MCASADFTRLADMKTAKTPDLIREIQAHEIRLLEKLLYLAIRQPDKDAPLPRDIIYKPELFVYIDGWGRTDDVCYVAEVQGRVAGAVWTRLFSSDAKGYGYVDDKTPEISISLFNEFRGQGIGTALMRHMIDKLMQSGYKQVSLSVSKDNPALRLYERLGFKTVSEEPLDYIMALALRR